MRWKTSVEGRMSPRCSRFRSTPSPMMPELRVIGRADEVGRQFKDGVVVEFGRQPLLGQLDAIAFDAREADFEASRSGARP